MLLEEVKIEQRVGELYIPEGADTDVTRQAKVIKLGEKVTLPIKEGDTVLFKPYAFEEIVFGLVDKKTYLLGKEENIHATLS